MTRTPLSEYFTELCSFAVTKWLAVQLFVAYYFHYSFFSPLPWYAVLNKTYEAAGFDISTFYINGRRIENWCHFKDNRPPPPLIGPRLPPRQLHWRARNIKDDVKGGRRTSPSETSLEWNGCKSRLLKLLQRINLQVWSQPVSRFGDSDQCGNGRRSCESWAFRDFVIVSSCYPCKFYNLKGSKRKIFGWQSVALMSRLEVREREENAGEMPCVLGKNFSWCCFEIDAVAQLECKARDKETSQLPPMIEV